MKDLIILAKGGTRDQCPFDGAEVWGVNDVGSFPEFKDKHLDRVFTFDPRTPEFLAEARSVAPVWSWRDYADVQYPLKDVCDRFFREGETPYFTNTLSYMLALAIYEGFERIRMYGVDAPYGGIYFMEKSGLEYWIGRAQQSGIIVTTATGSDILRTHDGMLYGQRGENSIQMYLSERMFIMNMLPKVGSYDDVYISSLLRWLVAIKVKEKDFHKISLQSTPDGKVMYQCDHEFQSTVHFPPWTLTYLRNTLQQLDKEGKLPINMIAVYDKLVQLNLPEKIGDIRDPYRDVRISYILNIKNRERFVRGFFENFKKIVKPEDELIIIDGGSTDGTKEIIDEYRHLADVYISEPDLSGSHALNKGILLARGRYVKHYPVDDVIYNLDNAVKLMDEKPEIDLLILGGIKYEAHVQAHTVGLYNFDNTPKNVFIYGACGTGFFHRRLSFAKTGMFHAVDVNADREFALRCMEKGVVKFLAGDFYTHAVYGDSTSVNGVDAWSKKNWELMKQYCPRSYYIKQRIRHFLHRLKINWS